MFYLHKSNILKWLFSTISLDYCMKAHLMDSKCNGVAYRDLVLWSSTVPQKWCHAVSSILLTFIHLHHWISRLVTSNCLRSCNKICVPSQAMIEFHSSLTGNISFFVGCEEAGLTLVVLIVSSEKQYNKPMCLLNFTWSVKYSTNFISERIFTDTYIHTYSVTVLIKDIVLTAQAFGGISFALC